VIELRPVTSENLDDCTELQVSPEQRDAAFADTVTYSLAEAYVFTKDKSQITTFPFAIYHNDEVIGFTLMEIVGNEGWIINFLIDQRFQHLGLGKAAFKECVKWFQDVHRVVAVLMPVNPGNHLVINAAKRYGFCDTGELDDDGNHQIWRFELPPTSVITDRESEIEYRETKSISDEKLRELYNSENWTAYTNQIENLEKLLDNCNIVYSAWEGDKLVGIIRTFGDNISICYIQDILVNPAYQGRGIGKRLLDYVLAQQADVRNIALSTDAKNNEYVLRWYEKQGFRNYKDIGIAGYARLAELVQ